MNKSELTFLIPFRQDSIERIENILLVTEFLTEHFETNVTILECAPFNNRLMEKLLEETIQYKFIEDNDPILFRTKYINQMVLKCETPFVAVWDTDVIAPVDQIIKAIEFLRNGEADFVYPYEKQFLDTSPILRKQFLQDRNIELLLQNMKKMKEMYPPNPVGGAFLANRDAYLKAGLENENFYGWGLEDGERYYRWENKGFRIRRISGPLFHLSHGRGLNSIFHNPDQMLYKQKETLKEIRNKNVNLTTQLQNIKNKKSNNL